MKNIPKYYLKEIRLLMILGVAVFFCACAPLKTVNLPDEHTPEPSEEKIWQTLEDIQPNNWFVLLSNSSKALDWRLMSIDSAQESIDLQTFLWNFDTVGSLVLNRLISAADRGVLVKILVDDTFLVSEDKMLEALASHPRIEYRIFNPYKQRKDDLVMRQFANLNEFQRVDHRMHNKAMIVDNRVAVIGGRNIADEYFGLHRDANFRDMELLVGGPIVQELSDSFDEYFNNDWSYPIQMISDAKPDFIELESLRHAQQSHIYRYVENAPEQRARVWEDAVRNSLTGNPELFVDKPPVDNPASTSSAPVQLAEQLAQLFDTAKEEILIISAYLIPTADFEGAIERAVKRGVSVRILTNSIQSNNHLAAHSAYRKHIKSLLEDGVQLHEVNVKARDRHLYMFPPTDKKSLALHAKVLVIDDNKVFLGSPNLDPRSLLINTEMGLLVESKELNAQVRSVVERDFSLANSWHLQFNEEGNVVWVSEDVVLDSQPAASYMQSLEDWFFMNLPIEDEM